MINFFVCINFLEMSVYKTFCLQHTTSFINKDEFAFYRVKGVRLKEMLGNSEWTAMPEDFSTTKINSHLQGQNFKDAVNLL